MPVSFKIASPTLISQNICLGHNSVTNFVFQNLCLDHDSVPNIFMSQLNPSHRYWDATLTNTGIGIAKMINRKANIYTE